MKKQIDKNPKTFPVLYFLRISYIIEKNLQKFLSKLLFFSQFPRIFVSESKTETKIV